MYKKYFLFIVICLLFNNYSKADNLHFDERLMIANGITTDKLKDVLDRHVIPAGMSDAEIYVNGTYVSDGEIFYLKDQLYTTKEFMRKSGINKNEWVIDKTNDSKAIYRLNKKIKFTYDRSDRSLRIVVPGMYLINKDDLRSIKGGFGSFVNYSTYAYHYSGSSGSMESMNVDYEAGINIDNAIIRSSGNYNRIQSRNTSFSLNKIRDGYLEKDIRSYRVRIGRTNISEGGFGAGYIDGTNISSGGGNATSFVNFSYEASEILTIEVWQNNLLLWKQIVQKGHAELHNVPVAGFNDDVTILVKRMGKIIDSRIISRGQISSVRDGTTGYYAFTGRTINANRALISGAGLSKTINHDITPSIAVITSGNYHGLRLGNSVSFGDVRTILQITETQNEKKQYGSSMNLMASYFNTTINYGYNSYNFSYLGQAQNLNSISERSNISVTYTKQFSDSITASTSLTHYNLYTGHNSNAFSNSISLQIGRAALGLGVSYMSMNDNRSLKNRMSLNASLSIPLGDDNQSSIFRSRYYAYRDNSHISNSLSKKVNDSYTVTSSHEHISGNSQSERIMFDNSVNTPYTNADVSVSQERTDRQKSQTTSAYFSGALAISQKGIVFSPSRIRNTWAIVDTGEHGFNKVSSLQNSVVTNHDGKAVISSINEDRADFIRVSPEGLPSGVVIKNNVRDFSAKRGTVAFVTFKAINNRSLLISWMGSPTWVDESDIFYNDAGKIVARFIDKGILLINEDDIPWLKTKGMMSSKKPNSRCKLENLDTKKLENINNVYFKCYE